MFPDAYLSDDDLINRKKYFEVPESAIEKFIISEQGQVAHALYWHKLLCVKDTMNGYCGSSGCSYDFVINDKIYELHGGSPPIIAEVKGTPIVLVKRSGGHCKTGPNAASCIKAYIWDDRWQQFNTPGGHDGPIK